MSTFLNYREYALLPTSHFAQLYMVNDIAFVSTRTTYFNISSPQT